MLKRLIIGIVLLMSLVLTGCNKPADINATLGEPFSLSIGQSASISSENLEIKFLDVIGDSRCPEGAVCIWEGEVSCQMEITYAGTALNKILVQRGVPGSSESEFNDYLFTFNVQPVPEVGKEIKKSDYRLQITVTDKPVLMGGVLATFDVLGEVYSIFITDAATIDQVYALESGNSQANIPSGRLVAGQVFYNKPWSWHIDPADVHMAEITIELCDGLPSMVEDDLDYWVDTVKRFCPWQAELVKIEDFR